jgi:hypothetical protein
MVARTAAQRAHGKVSAHGKEPAARQPNARTAASFAVQIVDAHGNGAVAVGSFAGRSLPCVRARQRLCRANKALCRANCRTAASFFPVNMFPYLTPEMFFFPI